MYPCEVYETPNRQEVTIYYNSCLGYFSATLSTGRTLKGTLKELYQLIDERTSV